MRALRTAANTILILSASACGASPPPYIEPPAGSAGAAVAGGEHAPPEQEWRKHRAPPALPTYLAVVAASETEEVLGMPNEFTLGLAGDEAALLVRRGATTGGPTCLRFLRLRRDDLSLITKTGCLRLNDPPSDPKTDVQWSQLGRAQSGWIALLRVGLFQTYPGTYEAAVVRFDDGGARLTTTLRLPAPSFEARSTNPGDGSAALFWGAQLITRPQGDPLLVYTDGPAVRAVRLDAQGRSTGSIELEPGGHAIVSAVAVPDGYLIARRAHAEERYSSARDDDPIRVTFIPARGADVETSQLSLGDVQSFHLVSASGGAAALVSLSDKSEWLVPLDARGRVRGERVEIPVHRYQGTFGPAVGVERALLLVHTDYGERHAAPDVSPVQFSLLTPSGGVLAERAPLSQGQYLHEMRAASDGKEAIVAWKEGKMLERFGIARVVGPQGAQVAGP